MIDPHQLHLVKEIVGETQQCSDMILRYLDICSGSGNTEREYISYLCEHNIFVCGLAVEKRICKHILKSQNSSFLKYEYIENFIVENFLDSSENSKDSMIGEIMCKILSSHDESVRSFLEKIISSLRVDHIITTFTREIIEKLRYFEMEEELKKFCDYLENHKSSRRTNTRKVRGVRNYC